MTDKPPIRLRYARSPKEQPFVNFGDTLSPIIVSALSGGHNIQWMHNSSPGGRDLTAIGTILQNTEPRQGLRTVDVWGTGLDTQHNQVSKYQDWTRVPSYALHATRGAFTELALKRLTRCRGKGGVYGDPALLLPYIHKKKVDKKHKIGVVVHMSELSEKGLEVKLAPHLHAYSSPEIHLINTYAPRTIEGVLAKVDEIRSCEYIFSSSLHGLVIADAWEIPNAPMINSASSCVFNGLIYDYSAHYPMDHRMRDYYSADKNRTHTFSICVNRGNPRHAWTNRVRSLKKHYRPMEVSPTTLLDAFPYLDDLCPEWKPNPNLEL